ncbi:MAG: hypothetical protein NXI30_13855 [bacterium]|nr:hypothetical protein [bacterium]
MRVPERRSFETPDSAHAPYPELVEPGRPAGRWKVLDSRRHDWLPSNGATIKVDRMLFVPLEEGGEPVSMHELAHVAWSPDRFPEVDYPLILLQAVEDARINQGLARVGLRVEPDRASLAHIAHLSARDGKNGRVAAVLLRAIASIGTSAEPVTRGEIEALTPRARALALEWLERVEARLHADCAAAGGPVAPFETAEAVAEELAAALRRYGLLEDDLKVKGMTCCYVAEGVEVGGALGLGERARRMIGRRLGLGEDAEDGGVEPGVMTIARPPLRVRLRKLGPPRFGALRSATEGAQIRRPDRLLIDRAIFARRGRAAGGTLLVDVSGSMSLDVDQVEAIVHAAGGAATVATYSGSGEEGELRIVAERGWRVEETDLAPVGSGNIVDLPALQWLSRQPEPRYWVSDGGVTDVGDNSCPHLRDRCMAVARRGRITRVEDADAALEALGAASR